MNTLKIYRPIRSSRVSQPFGANHACIHPSGQVVTRRAAECPTGSVPFYKSLGMDGHNGIDYPAIEGENVVHAATYDGWMHTEVDSAGGIGVDVISNEPLFFLGKPPTGLKLPTVVQNGVEGFLCHVKLRSWHLKTVIGWEGRQVKHGQVIGLAGNTGASSGPHLHFGFKYCDKNGKSLLRNAYSGASDPAPFLNNQVYAGDNVSYGFFPATPLTDIEQKQVAVLSLQKQILLFIRELIYKL